MVITSRIAIIRTFAAIGAVLLLPLAAAAVPPAGWTAAVAEGPDAAARAIERERGRGGYRAMDPLAAALATPSASGALSDPHISLADQASPDSTYLHWERLRLALDSRSPAAVGREGLRLLGAAAADPWLQLTTLAVFSVALCAAAWFATAALVLYHGVGRGRLLLHDYSDSFPARFRRVTPVALGIFVLSVLWAAGIGPLVVLVLVGVALTPYMNLRARLVFGLAACLGCLLPAATAPLASWTGSGADSAWLTYRVQRGDAGADLLAELRSAPGGRGRNRYLAARVTRRNGDWAAAAGLLGSAGDGLEPGLLANERGNLAFLNGDLERAQGLYREAAAARSGDPVPWLNQHLVHLKRLELDAADAALARARQEDDDLTERFEAVRSADPETLYPVSHRVPWGWVAATFVAGGDGQPPWSRALWHVLFLPGNAVRPVYVGVFALVIALLAGRAGQDRRSRPCPSCGFVVCPRCSRRVKGSLLCSACWSADKDREVDATERQRRAESAARWERLRSRGRRLAHAVLPGWGDALGPAPLRGSLVALLWAGGAGFALVALLFPLPLFAWGGLRFHWAVGGLALGLAYVAGVRRALRNDGGG
ncbi:MAG: hypothetical protein P1P84_09500 [Deferrisomatales bacterium]|nr:hypothetical protein [Deferrisomatales bacterium]